MNVRLESMCQGDGKLYLLMALDRINPDAAIYLNAHLKDGTKVPAYLLLAPEQIAEEQATHVVIVPHYDVREIDLDFTEVSSENAPIGYSRLTVETGMVKWRTRINTLVRNELIAQMYDIEREYCVNRINVYFTEVIPDGEEYVVKMLADMPYHANADVMARFLDNTGHDYDLPTYPLLDEISPAERFGNEDRLHVGFSVRVPRSNKEFCVVVYDANDEIPSGFAQFSDETLEPLQESFEYNTQDAFHDPAYDEWFHRHCETLAGLALQRKRTLATDETFSIILPVFPGEEPCLQACLDALDQQTFSDFQLVVVDACLGEAGWVRTFGKWATDERTTRIHLDEGSDWATAYLNGIFQSTDTWCFLMSPRIVLCPEALFEFRRVMAFDQEKQEPQKRCQVLYSNHDTIDEQGQVSKPCFKPAYSPDYLYSFDYMGPLVAFKRDLIEQVAQTQGFASEAFVYDLEIKACARAQAVERIDQVLYHVQDPLQFGQTTQKALHLYEDDLFRGGRKAVANQMRRDHTEAVVLADFDSLRYRIRYRVPEEEPTVSVIIPTRDHVNLLRTCLTSLFEHNSYGAFEVVIVDDHSVEEETFDYYRYLQSEDPHVVRIINHEGVFSLAAMINEAARTCTSDYLMVLDNDTECISQEALTYLIGRCARKDVGVVGARLLFSDDTVQHAGILMGAYGSASNIGVNLPRTAQGYMKRLICAHNVSAVTGACQVIKREVFDQVGGYNERFMINYADVDFCLRVNKAGYRAVYDGDIEFYHHENATRGHALTPEQQIRLEKERAYLHYLWAEVFLEGDPYMSSCLDPSSPYWQLTKW